MAKEGWSWEMQVEKGGSIGTEHKDQGLSFNWTRFIPFMQ